MNKDVCCEPLNTKLWDEKKHTWKKKLFLKDEVIQFMHMPLNMGSVVRRMFKKIEDSNASPDTKDFLMLCYDPSPWKSEIYMTITKPTKEGEVTKLSGNFISKVFEGPYHAVPKWLKVMELHLASKNQKALKHFIHYAYCPKCSKKYGVNHAIVFSKVK